MHYHFECLTIAQFARFALADGTTSPSLTFSIGVSKKDQATIHKKINDASKVELPPYPLPLKNQEKQRRMDTGRHKRKKLLEKLAKLEEEEEEEEEEGEGEANMDETE